MSGMTTCERCGGGVPAGATTCPNCGAPTATDGGEQWVTTDPQPSYENVYNQPADNSSTDESRGDAPAWSAPEPAPAQATMPAPPVYTPPLPNFSAPAAEIFTPGEPGKKSTPWWMWVIGCCAGVLFLVCCLAAIAIAAMFAWL